LQLLDNKELTKELKQVGFKTYSDLFFGHFVNIFLHLTTRKSHTEERRLWRFYLRIRCPQRHQWCGEQRSIKAMFI